MKKYFIMAVAVLATLTACQPDEPQTTIVETREISFAPAATQTRATPVDETVVSDLENNGFAVYGWVKPTADGQYQQIFAGEAVTLQQNTNVWQPTGADVKYWAPNSDYWFSALYPRGAANYQFTTSVENTEVKHTQTITNFSIDPVDTKDIVVARPSKAVLAEEQQRAAVGLVFDHMLSRVHFSFTNTFADNNVTIEISNVVLHNVVKTANATISAGTIDDNTFANVGDDATAVGMATWTKSNEDKTTLNFCDVQEDVFTLVKDAVGTTAYRLFIPTEAVASEYKLAFDLAVKADGVTVLTKQYTIADDQINTNDAIGLIVPNDGYKSGQSYIFNANISGNILTNEIYPITFTVKVTDWAADETVDADIMD